MKIELWYIGKNAFDFVQSGINIYRKRIEKYVTFSIEEIPDVKNQGAKSNSILLKKLEGKSILKKLNDSDILILLDESGKSLGSLPFSEYLNNYLISGKKKIVFLIGGAYGFDEKVYSRAQGSLSLSPMTFSHQLIRIVFLEQLYRGFTILRGEPYHNE
jgi:23S rRNA (pseudouridine1915-N3)-methyltransferase